MKNVSIKDIAKFTGFSTATISRVINDNGRFSEETRLKVMNAIEKLGYRSNVVAKSLRTMKTYTIGVIVPDITNEFFSKLVLGVESYCYPNGYSVYICNTSEDGEKEIKSIADLEAKGVDGLIDLGGGAGEASQNILRKIPIVYIDRQPMSKNVSFVESDNFHGGYIATEELIKQGCRDIILLRDYRDLSTMNQRVNGYLSALTDYKVPIDLNKIHKMSVNVENARECVDELIELGNIFDGIFAATDWLAVGALSSLKSHKIKVPDEVKIVGYDNIQITEFVDPRITTVNQDKYRMGATAAKLLLEIIDNKSKKNENITIPVELIERETT